MSEQPRSEAEKILERRLKQGLFEYILRTGEFKGPMDIEFSVEDEVAEQDEDGLISVDTENLRRSHISVDVELQ